MTALSTPRRIQRRDGRSFSIGVAAAAVCIQSGLAILASGFARPGRTGQGGSNILKAADAATYQAIGVFTESVTGGVADGDQVAKIESGVFNFVQSAGVDAITDADIGRPCYIVDDQTVARTSANNTRAVAGIVEDVDADGVWVAVGPQYKGGRRTILLPYFINQTDLLAGTSAELISPVVGEIVNLFSTVQIAVTTGGPLTAKVAGVAVDGLSIAVADGATKGTVQSDTPTAGHASTLVTVGSRIEVVPDAAFNTAGALNGFVEIAF